MFTMNEKKRNINKRIGRGLFDDIDVKAQVKAIVAEISCNKITFH